MFPSFQPLWVNVSQGLVMGTYVLCFYHLMEVLQSSAFLLLALILTALHLQFPTTSSPARGSSNSRCSSHKGEAGGDRLFPVGWWFHAGPCRSGCATYLVSRVLGEDVSFPHCCISHWLWSSWKEGAVLHGGQMHIGSRCWVIAES